MRKHRANDVGDGIDNSKKRKPTSRGSILDDLIGEQIRQLRQEKGLSQTDLGRLIGVSYQQIQKNETGENRIAASRLLMISVTTKKPIEYFVKTARTHLEKTT